MGYTKEFGHLHVDVRCGDLNSQILGASSNNWLVVWNMNFITFHILGMSSSQLTFIFVRGVKTTNQNKDAGFKTTVASSVQGSLFQKNGEALNLSSFCVNMQGI